MNRPKIITHALASLDGKITIAPDTLLLFGDARWEKAAGPSDGVYRRIMETHKPQAMLEGSGSLVLEGQPVEPLPPAGGDPDELYQDYLPENIVHQPNRRWLACVDGRGRVRWLFKEFPGETWVGWHLLVLVSRCTPADYLAYLRREGIPYLVAGDGEKVDLQEAMAKLREKLGVERLVSTAGGRLNAALIRAGLVDEVNVELFPAVIGGARTPGLFSGPELGPDEQPALLELVSTQTLDNGHVWLRYRVKSEV